MGEQNAAYLEKINRAAAAIEAACGGAEIAVILGSGLGGYAEALENPTFLAYQDIPGFPVSTGAGPCGPLVRGHAAWQARVHDAGPLPCLRGL